ncbi:MAG TPA: 23S rRNA (guanosine(2251)-2'-O)-methyltransferase RlmB [Herpetosiphon sp.]|uniref:RNA methyltransferase, TrmH family, group 3 n=1 Tax=Herpetosiphon aurantiacus (strain ATCC 23779 / DSM 785 / 114-95) TaxID=316274 RepID=A9B7C6_HERA2|nr:23S rRNA (guanosine(2251)-2'-O)-methyltransferase RlmB [Herpetosiphon sp.]ABX06409.1 RNA methyltransferase, TrmH family, group 3 [Herpetosiphon aurantiacus DSM 785]HBW49844.1 23S rRNA (guanosine(2251)-2'-O)-methyltransferase RlmB [Herpetosiphon sp.]
MELLYGRNAVLEALRANRRKLGRLLIADGIKEGESMQAINTIARERRMQVAKVQRSELDKRTAGANHQGIALECGAYPYVEVDDIIELARERGEQPLILIFDHLQDPQNIGTLMRTAEIVGAHGIIFPDRRSASITPAVINASAGAVEHLYVAQITNIAQTIKHLQEYNIWVAGVEDDERAVDFDKANLRGALALVIGAEGPGLARLTRERCDLLVRLPMRGNVASLNAATAGSIILYHAWRVREK